MKTRSPFLIALAFLASASIAIPPDLLAQSGQKAGEVSRAIRRSSPLPGARNGFRQLQ